MIHEVLKLQGLASNKIKVRTSMLGCRVSDP